MDQEKLFIATLKNGHKSATRPRLVVFHELRSATEPLSIFELYQATKKHLDRASVYRTIDLFLELGIARKVPVGWKYKIELSDMFTPHHHHIVCEKCGYIVDIHSNKELETTIEHIVKSQEFVHTHHSFEITGICSKCRRT